MSGRGELIRDILLKNYESYYRLAFSYVHQEADAMDIVQEGAYKAMLKADTLRREAFAGTWVYRIMINEAKEYIRKNKRDYAEPEEIPAVEEPYRDMDLKEAVENLPEQERTLIILRFYEDKQLTEIAEILQENLSTVKSRLYRTLKKLREELEEPERGRQDMGMKDNRSIEERLFEGKENYRRIPVPAEMKAKLEEGIRRAEEELKKEQQDAEGNVGEEKAGGREKTNMTENKEKRTGNKKKVVRFRLAAAVAAAVVILIALPNTGAGIAHAMGSLPVVGKLFQAVTFRDYQYESERFEANVEVPQIVVEDVAGEETGQEKDGAQSQSGSQTSDKLQETVEQINFDIEEVTNQLIEEFQASADLGESYGGLEIHHETVTDNERYFTLKLSIYQVAGSGSESYKFYTIDKTTGEQIQIGDLFKEGSDYNERLTGNIQNQMRAEMKADENKIYWVDYEDVPEWNWDRLKEDQNFYVDEAGNIVISFDEYEVAPGYMGALEFTVERSVFEDILKG